MQLTCPMHVSATVGPSGHNGPDLGASQDTSVSLLRQLSNDLSFKTVMLRSAKGRMSSLVQDRGEKIFLGKKSPHPSQRQASYANAAIQSNGERRTFKVLGFTGRITTSHKGWRF